MLKKNLVGTILFTYGLLTLFTVMTSMKPRPAIPQDKPFYLSWQKADTSYQLVEHFDVVLLEETAGPKIALSRHASSFVKSYLVKEDEILQMVKKRSTTYFPIIESVFERHGLPIELKYLAVVESDLKTSALSRVGARGMWQLMPTTARELGLKVSSRYDERTHAYKSTVAAAKYLKDLYTQFGDWLLVIAAYNCGPGPVYSAVKKSGSKNFWALQYYLPQESRGHVKRFIGTHYFFEGEGSLVTLTKSETLKYTKEVEAYKASLLAREVADTVNAVAFFESK